MKEIIMTLLFYLGQQGLESGNVVSVNTDDESTHFISITTKALPPVLFLDKKELVKVAYNGDVPAGFDYKTNSTLALYNHKNHTIYLHDSVDLDTVFGKSVLLHELVHFNQYAMGDYDTAECIASNENLAYQVQNKYLEDHGLPALYSDRHIFFASLCLDYI